MTTTPDPASMSDTPTFASLFLQWSAGGAGARADVYAHLKQTPADAAALEGVIRHELTSEFAWNRTLAAEAMVEVYGDEPAAGAALGWVFRQGDPAAALDAVPTLRKLSPEHAAPRFAELALHTSSVFRGLAPDILRRAARAAVLAGPDGVGPLLTMLAVADEAEPPLLMGLADTAPRVAHDLTDLEPRLRGRVRHATTGYAAGAALWRLTWRVNRDWLASLDPHSPQLGDGSFLALLIDVLTEHLGRRPDLAPLVRELLLRLAAVDAEMFGAMIPDVAKLGRGWSVLLPLLGHRAAPPGVRECVFREAAARPAVWPLAHHHAHAVILERASYRTAVSAELLDAACGLLRSLGFAAGSALPDVLDLIVRQPDTARPLADTVRALASVWPLPAAAVARTLDRLRRSVVFSPDAFAVLADVYAEFARGAWPRLVEDTGFDVRTVAALLEQPAWAAALPDAREADARRLADRLISPRAEVRVRAAELLRHYPDQVPKVWPALVAVLTGADERAALVVVPYFRDLTPVAGAVAAELAELFREPNPVYAARAAVALWRLGRVPVVADELLRSATAQADCAWGWAVLRAVVGRAWPGRDLSDMLVAPPDAVAVRVHALLSPPELPEDRAIGQHVRPMTPAGGAPVYWDGVYQCVGNDSEGGLLFLALMCAYGSAGFGSQKIWMIKHQRGLSGNGLAEAKAAVELATDKLTAGASAADKRDGVRGYFRSPHGLPKALTDLLEHRLSWYRWAGLELLDAWGEPEAVPPLIAERVWDRSALVRARALRMYAG